MSAARTPLERARQLRNDIIIELELTARSLLTSDSEVGMSKAVDAVATLLEAAEAQIEPLSTSNPGYAERDLPTETREALTAARMHVSKLCRLYPKDV